MPNQSVALYALLDEHANELCATAIAYRLCTGLRE
jgi:hypothetical protein